MKINELPFQYQNDYVNTLISNNEWLKYVITERNFNRIDLNTNILNFYTQNNYKLL